MSQDFKSWAPQVKTGNDPTFYSNALRFATEQEARENAHELMGRWMAVVDYRAVESEDPVTHRWVDGKLEEINAD
jgi:hypothetical protein